VGFRLPKPIAVPRPNYRDIKDYFERPFLLTVASWPSTGLGTAIFPWHA